MRAQWHAQAQDRLVVVFVIARGAASARISATGVTVAVVALMVVMMTVAPVIVTMAVMPVVTAAVLMAVIAVAVVATGTGISPTMFDGMLG